MAAPIITPIPTPPIRSDAPADFSAKADAFAASLPQFVTETNASAAFVDQRAIDADASAQAAAASANAAAQSAESAGSVATNVSAEVAKAEAARDDAQVAAAAAGAAAGLPALSGNAGKFLGVNPSATGVVFYDVGQKIGDSLTTARAVDGTYLQEDGGIYLQSAYPALFAALGLIGGNVGTVWSAAATGLTSVVKVVRGNNGTLVGITTLSNTVVRSTDNGSTWASINAGTGTYAIDVDTDGDGKWIIQLSQAVGGFTQRVSTNDGLSWEGYTNAWISTSGMVFCRYVGSGLWLAGGANRLVKTTDNGITWGQAEVSPAVSSGAVCSADRNGTCIICVPSVGVFRSIDGFATTTTAPTGASATVSDMTTDRNGTWVSVGAGGAILRSLDNGQKFAAVASGTTTGFNSVSTDGSGVWIIGGGSGTLRRSSDNLNTFESISGLAGTVQTVLMTDAYALAGSNNGSIYRSAPSYPYDTATQFRVPQGTPPQGLSSYIKAQEVA